MGFKSKKVSVPLESDTRQPDYPCKLKDLPLGEPFQMLNYGGWYMRIEFSAEMLSIKVKEDKYHVPIVDFETSQVFWMSKEKPCKTRGTMITEELQQATDLYDQTLNEHLALVEDQKKEHEDRTKKLADLRDRISELRQKAGAKLEAHLWGKTDGTQST